MPPSPMVVVGSANADLVFQIDRLPKPGETMGASSLETLPGGKVISMDTHDELNNKQTACRGRIKRQPRPSSAILLSSSVR